MHIKDIGIVIAKKSLQERLQIITVFTKEHGLYSGVTKESSKKANVSSQVGSLVDFIWQARLHEHIGTVKCEPRKSYIGYLLSSKSKLYAFNAVSSLLKIAFHEREPHNNFFPTFHDYLERQVSNVFSLKDYIQLELAILAEAGYGLELKHCAVSGKDKDLCFVSPKSGKAVSRKEGELYADKLLTLPEFLTRDVNRKISQEEITAAFHLTSYFFNRYFFHNYQMPEERTIFIEHIKNQSCF